MKNTLFTIFLIIIFVSFISAQTPTSTPIPTLDEVMLKRAITETGDKAADNEIENSLTLENFGRIELGMSYEQVKGIVGSDGNETSSSKIGENTRISYQWKGDKFASIRAAFRNNKLTSKSQSNVGDRYGDAELDLDKFRLIQVDMSYEVVVGILGSEGEMTRISEIGKTTLTAYTWKGPKYERIFANFKDGKLQNKSQSSLK